MFSRFFPALLAAALFSNPSMATFGDFYETTPEEDLRDSLRVVRFNQNHLDTRDFHTMIAIQNHQILKDSGKESPLDDPINLPPHMHELLEKNWDLDLCVTDEIYNYLQTNILNSLDPIQLGKVMQVVRNEYPEGRHHSAEALVRYDYLCRRLINGDLTTDGKFKSYHSDRWKWHNDPDYINKHPGMFE